MEAVAVSNEGLDTEENTENVFVCDRQNVVQNHCTCFGNKCCESMAELTCLGVIVTNQN
jgi:hypothetical protein